MQLLPSEVQPKYLTIFSRDVLYAASTSLRNTASSVMLPFTEPDAPRSNSIQPSLKPSSIRIRGVGFFIPCDLNRLSHDARGIASTRTGYPRIFEKMAAT